MTEVSDVRLLERARRGDEAAFSELFGRFQRAIHRYGSYMCGLDAADDIVQETFLAVLRQSRRDDPPHGPVLGYLLGIARHRVLKRATARSDLFAGELNEAVEVAAAADEPTAFDDVARAEMIARVRDAVRALPGPYREVIVLCELQELDYAAAAAIIRCPIGTIRSRLHRARALLAVRLGAPAPVARGN